MKIKQGFNDKESQIRIEANTNGSIELWMVQPGLPEERYQETLSYLTADELLALKMEVQRAARDLFSI